VSEPELVGRRLGLVSEGFCPYCETPLKDRVLVRSIARGRCTCCGGLFRTIASERFGPGVEQRKRAELRARQRLVIGRGARAASDGVPKQSRLAKSLSRGGE